MNYHRYDNSTLDDNSNDNSVIIELSFENVVFIGDYHPIIIQLSL